MIDFLAPIGSCGCQRRLWSLTCLGLWGGVWLVVMGVSFSVVGRHAVTAAVWWQEQRVGEAEGGDR